MCIVLLLQVVLAHVEVRQESVISLEVCSASDAIESRYNYHLGDLRSILCFAVYGEPGVSGDLQKQWSWGYGVKQQLAPAFAARIAVTLT